MEPLLKLSPEVVDEFILDELGSVVGEDVEVGRAFKCFEFQLDGESISLPPQLS